MSNYSATIEFFSSLCQNQLNQPLSRLDAANDALGATLAVMYAVSAVVSAYFFLMWKRADADVKSRVWRRYGWFSALAFFGSIAGLVTAAADIQLRYIFQRAMISTRYDDCNKIKSKDYKDRLQYGLALAVCYQEPLSKFAPTLNWLSVSPVPYAIEFLCICCANLLVVERMVDFVGKGQLLGGRWLSMSARFAVVSVTVLNATNLAFMAVFSYFSAKGSSYFNQLFAKLQNPTLEFLPCLVDGVRSPNCHILPFTDFAFDAFSRGLTFAGYGSICEGCSLVIMLVSFLVAGALCIRRFYTGATNKSTEAGRRNNKVRRQIIATVSTVFVTFLIRSVYAAVLAASRQGSNLFFTPFVKGKSDYDSACKNDQNLAGVCDPCQGLGLIVQIWLYLCPAFPFTVFLLSSPVTILVALWGMTTQSFFESLRWKGRKNVTLGGGLKSFIKAGGEP